MNSRQTNRPTRDERLLAERRAAFFGVKMNRTLPGGSAIPLKVGAIGH